MQCISAAVRTLSEAAAPSAVSPVAATPASATTALVPTSTSSTIAVSSIARVPTNAARPAAGRSLREDHIQRWAQVTYHSFCSSLLARTDPVGSLIVLNRHSHHLAIIIILSHSATRLDSSTETPRHVTTEIGKFQTHLLARDHRSTTVRAR